VPAHAGISHFWDALQLRRDIAEFEPVEPEPSDELRSTIRFFVLSPHTHWPLQGGGGGVFHFSQMLQCQYADVEWTRAERHG